MSTFKNGDRVKRIAGQDNRKYGVFIGDEYIVRTITESGDLQLEGVDGSWYTDNFELVSSNGFIINYNATCVEKQNNIMSNIKEFVKNSLLSANEKTLREVGFKDSCGNYTQEARDFAINILCEEKEEKMIEVAKALLVEQKKK